MSSNDATTEILNSARWVHNLILAVCASIILVLLGSFPDMLRLQRALHEAEAVALLEERLPSYLDFPRLPHIHMDLSPGHIAQAARLASAERGVRALYDPQITTVLDLRRDVSSDLRGGMTVEEWANLLSKPQISWLGRMDVLALIDMLDVPLLRGDSPWVITSVVAQNEPDTIPDLRISLTPLSVDLRGPMIILSSPLARVLSPEYDTSLKEWVSSEVGSEEGHEMCGDVGPPLPSVQPYWQDIAHLTPQQAVGFFEREIEKSSQPHPIALAGLEVPRDHLLIVGTCLPMALAAYLYCLLVLAMRQGCQMSLNGVPWPALSPCVTGVIYCILGVALFPCSTMIFLCLFTWRASSWALLAFSSLIAFIAAIYLIRSVMLILEARKSGELDSC